MNLVECLWLLVKDPTIEFISGIFAVEMEIAAGPEWHAVARVAGELRLVFTQFFISFFKLLWILHLDWSVNFEFRSQMQAWYFKYIFYMCWAWKQNVRPFCMWRPRCLCREERRRGGNRAGYFSSLIPSILIKHFGNHRCTQFCRWFIISTKRNLPYLTVDYNLTALPSHYLLIFWLSLTNTLTNTVSVQIQYQTARYK